MRILEGQFDMNRENYLLGVINRVKRLHAPKDYEIKNIGTMQICSICRDDKGNNFVMYPCETVRLLHP